MKTKNANEILKPCPICGAKAYIWNWTDGAAVQCDDYNPYKHNVKVVADTREQAAKLWNDRKFIEIEGM